MPCNTINWNTKNVAIFITVFCNYMSVVGNGFVQCVIESSTVRPCFV